MIRPREKIKLFIQGETVFSNEFPNGIFTFDDYTDKLINVSTVSGVDKFTGIGQQPDTGQLSLVSTSTALDPYTNPEIRSGKIIVIAYENRNNSIFTGRISNVNIEYRPKDDPIITINAIDAIGELSNSLFFNDPNLINVESYSFSDILWTAVYMYKDPLPGIFEASEFLDPIGFAAIAPADQAYEQILKGATGRLGFIYADRDNFLNYYDHNKYLSLDNKPPIIIGAPGTGFIRLTETNEDNLVHAADQIIEQVVFDSEGIEGIGYKSINIDDGFDRIINQIEITSTSSVNTDPIPDPQFPGMVIYTNLVREDTESPVFEKQSSIDEWGVFSASIETYIPNEWMDYRLESSDPVPVDIEATQSKIAANYLEAESMPGREVTSITFDGTLYPEVAENIRINDKVRVKHKVSDTFTIDSNYLIVGVKNEIDESNWLIELALRPAVAARDIVPKPTLTYTTSDSNSDTRTVFTFTVDASEEIMGVSWIWNDTFGSADLVSVKQTLPNQIQHIFEDPGTEPYNPENLPYAVAAVVEYENGWKRATNSVFVNNIVPEQPFADFSYTANSANGVVNFSFAGRELNEYFNVDADAGPIAFYGNKAQTFSWNFGDGTTSTQKNPNKTYTIPSQQSSFQVTLTVTSGLLGAAQRTDTITKTVQFVEPTADFNWAQDSSIWNKVNFAFDGANALSYAWEFGDGFTSTQKNPSRTYSEPGPYQVTLTVANNFGTDTITIPIEIIAPPGAFGTLPIRYLRLSQAKHRDSLNEISSSKSTVPHFLSMFQARTLTGTNHALGKPVISLSVQHGKVARGGTDTTFPPASCYGGTQYADRPNWDRATSPTRLTDTLVSSSLQGIMPMSKKNSTEPGECTQSQWSLVIDIQQERNDIQNIRMQFPAMSSNQPKPLYTVEASQNNINWTPLGVFNLSGINASNPSFVTMTPSVTMPANIPAFNYTIIGNTLTWESTTMNDDSYLIVFGDGTTSTAGSGTKNYIPGSGRYFDVVMSKTRSGVTRTLEVSIEVANPYLNPFAFRYAKLVQDTHTGTHQYDTPYINGFRPQNNFNDADTNRLNGLGTGKTVFVTESYPVDFKRGTSNSTMNVLSSPDNERLVGDNGLRVQAESPTFTTGWELVVDYGQTFSSNSINNFAMKVGNLLVTDPVNPIPGQPPVVSQDISYTVYITNFTGTMTNPASHTWTPVGTMRFPGGVPASTNTKYYVY